MQFYIVDVFAEEKYAGNQLAVIRDAEGLSDEAMLKLAQEMNYSETTFILRDKPRDGGYDVRIFTPAGEVPFAGHPTLGTAYIIRQEIIGRPVEDLTLNLKVGPIPVTFNDDDDGLPNELWMHQRPPQFGDVFDPALTARALNIDVADIDPRFPVQHVSTGLPFAIVPLTSRDAIKRCRANPEVLDRLLEPQQTHAIFMFCSEPYHPQNQLNARMFAPELNIVEDPATGSANGCLAGYLVKHRYFGGDEIDIRVEQGYEIGRPSLLLLRARQLADSIDVFVGGQVVPVARGELV
jgi:trans-2,3-dihydro-3-hydroxyanthranilate isomerase